MRSRGSWSQQEDKRKNKPGDLRGAANPRAACSLQLAFFWLLPSSYSQSSLQSYAGLRSRLFLSEGLLDPVWPFPCVSPECAFDHPTLGINSGTMIPGVGHLPTVVAAQSPFPIPPSGLCLPPFSGSLLLSFLPSFLPSSLFSDAFAD